MALQTVTVGLSLDERLTIRTALAAEIARLQTELDFENQAIKDQMTAEGIDRYESGDQVMVLSVRPGRKTLDKGRLVELGVSTDIIAAATKEGPAYVQLDVREKK